MSESSLIHPSPERLAAFDRGRLPPEELAEVERHVNSCDRCCRQLEGLPDDNLLRLMKAAAPRTDTRDQIDEGTDEGPPAEIPPELVNHPRYRILSVLGSGGMGVVYKAEHRIMERVVALKVISRKLTARGAAVERFRQEVKAAARLSHPNIVTAHDAEQEGDLHFLVMEYVAGVSLESLVQVRGPLTVGHACYLAREVALGLQHAHERGMTHRDVKPGNILLTPLGQVKVLDFGLARFVSEEQLSHALTPEGAVVGTPDYVAPEQARNPRSADIRADVYSLGCTLYHLLTGAPPFAGGTLMEKLLAHQHRPAAPLATYRTDLPAGLGAVVARMIAKAPDERYPTPAAAAEALAPFAHAPGPADIGGIRPAADSPSTSQLATLCPPGYDRRRPRRVWPAAVALLLLLTLAGIGYLAWLGAHSPQQLAVTETSSESSKETPSLSRLIPDTPHTTVRIPAQGGILDRDALRARMASWLKEETVFAPKSQELADLLRKADTPISKGEGVVLRLGAGLTRSGRPTIVVARCGLFHAFALSPEEARGADLPEKLIVHIELNEDPPIRSEPMFILSNVQIASALNHAGDQPFEGTVAYQNLTGYDGRLVLRMLFMGWRRNAAWVQPLAARTAPRGSLNLRTGPDMDKECRIPGPGLILLELGINTREGDREYFTIVSNSAYALVNVAAPKP